ncbi:Armadillo [Dillenia turbinata]|uniref:RING-type E3 ubiquitin transferase n=1 Tax=Dillenia turbinata TaxID=194707 RepID=A0AAN8W660_9MAGN
MDAEPIRCLINSMSRLIHLVSCQTLKSMPTQKDFKKMVDLLKILKLVLNEVVDQKIPLDENLIKECEELDIATNEARELFENWSPKMSRIYCVVQSGPVVMKVRCSSLEFCRKLCGLLQSSPSAVSLTGVQHCVQEFEGWELAGISELIEEALKRQRDVISPSSRLLIRITELLNLNSSQELLKESIAVEKEKNKVHDNQIDGEIDCIEQIVDLLSCIRSCLVKLVDFEAINGVPIPPYFRCPLSLELMLDPVIVASGQTYQRTSIQKWVDNGLFICPNTSQKLMHTNLIPNYTVRALIANWCDEKNIRVLKSSGCSNIPSVTPDNLSPQVILQTDSFHSQQSSNSTSRSSLEVDPVFEKHNNSGAEKSDMHQSREIQKFDQPSPDQSYIHSRSESVSSAISSIEYVPTAQMEVSRTLDNQRSGNDLSGEITSVCPASRPLNKDLLTFPRSLAKKYHSSISKSSPEAVGNGNINFPRTLSFPLSDSGSDDLTTVSHVQRLVVDLNSQSPEAQRAAAEEIRLLAKHNMENRKIVGQCGAIPSLVSLLYSDNMITQEHAVTALLNLSIYEENKAMIASTGVIEPLIHALETGNAGAKENSAATLFSLSILEEYKEKIGRSRAVKALVDLLGSGTLRGKKDAATALFNLSIFHDNKARIVQAGAVKYLVELLDPTNEMVDKAVALLANLSTISEGRSAIAREKGIPLLVEILETGSQRGKENAASTLLQLCLNSSKYCGLVLQEGAVPPLVALSHSGTTRAQEKAQQLLSHFRTQREGSKGKGKS